MKLTRKELEQLDYLKSDLQEKQDNLESAIDDFNSQVNELWADLVQECINEYNQSVAKAQKFANEIQQKLETYYDERTGTWQTSDRGIAFRAWIWEWDVSLDEVETSFPDVDLPDMTAFDELDMISEQPG